MYDVNVNVNLIDLHVFCYFCVNCEIKSSFDTLICMILMQKLKTRVIKKDINPVWNEDLTLSVADPNVPVALVFICPLLSTYTTDVILYHVSSPSPLGPDLY